MISTVNWDTVKLIVELGPGDGCITREIIKRMKPGTVLLSFETNEAFVEEYLRFDHPDVHIIHDTAEKIGDYIKKYGFDKADYVISSLPLTNFSEELKNSLLDASFSNLKEGGLYMQFQYMTTAKKLLKARSNKVSISFVPMNLPPAFVYTCVK